MNGTLEDTTPAGVLQVLSSQRSTGAVRFFGDSGCTVYLHQGELYFAESPDTAEDLAMALVRPSRLTAEQWDSATESGYPTETVGEDLITTGGITRELLASVVLSVIYDPLIQLFRAPEGDYEFAPDVVHWIGPYRTFSVDAIVSEVRRRTREADEMAPVVPSLDAVVRSARTLPESHGSVKLRRDDWEVVVAASGGRTVSELAAELGRGRWSTARIVYRLAIADLLMVTPADPSGGLGDAVGAETTLGFDAADAPPPLDPSLVDQPTPDFAPADSWDAPVATDDTWSAAPQDAWAMPTAADDRSQDDSTGDDAWGEFDATASTTESWDPASLYGDSADTTEDDSEEDSSGWGSPLSAVPDQDSSTEPDTDLTGAEAEFEPPALHPDIAKALAESTYADSATAINAMAARLGAIESDDDDDWDAGGTEESSDDDLWGAGSGSADEDFIWKPAAWDTGVEAAPLPQRASARAGVGPDAGAPADPAWLDSLYSEFMPGDPNAPKPAGDAAASEDDPGAAPKQRTLRRLISAIRRL